MGHCLSDSTVNTELKTEKVVSIHYRTK